MSPTLYHASTQRLEVINPCLQTASNGRQGFFVFAQPDRLIAHAYALKSATPVVFHISRHVGGIVCLAANNRQSFMNSLHQDERGRGGFIHEVDPALFTPIGSEDEYVAEGAVPVINPPRFVTLEDVMLAGVQIFISLSPLYKVPANPGDTIASLVSGHSHGIVAWLNQEYALNPITI